MDKYRRYFIRFLFILSILHQSLFGSSENGGRGIKMSLILKSMTFFELKLWSHINRATHIAAVQRKKHKTVLELPDFVNEDETSIKQMCQKSETAGFQKSTVGFMVKKTTHAHYCVFSVCVNVVSVCTHPPPALLVSYKLHSEAIRYTRFSIWRATGRVVRTANSF